MSRLFIDLDLDPDFNSTVLNGTQSVSQGKVTQKRLWDQDYPFCVKHGAMNKVNAFGYWRCLACGEGAFEIETL